MLNLIHGAGFKVKRIDRSGLVNQWCFGINLNDVDVELTSVPITSGPIPNSMLEMVGARRQVIVLIPPAYAGDCEINRWWNEFTCIWETVRPGRKERVYNYFVNYTGLFGANAGVMTLMGWSAMAGKDRVSLGGNTGPIVLPTSESYAVAGTFSPLSLATMIGMWNDAMTLWLQANAADLLFPTLTWVDATHFTLSVPFERKDTTIMFSNMSVVTRGYGEEPFY